MSFFLTLLRLINYCLKHIAICFFILPWYLYGPCLIASTPLIDSLIQTISITDSEKEKVDIYNKIAFQYLFVDTIKLLDYIDTSKVLSKDIDYPQGIARALNIHAIHHSFQGRYEEGISLNKKALSYCEEDDHFVKGKIHNGLGLAYQRQYIVDKCLDHYQQALFHSSEIKDTLTMAVVLGNIAGVNSTQENDKEAKKYFLQLEEVASNYKNQNVQFAFHIRFGEFLTQTEEYEESNKYLERALINAEALKHNSKIRKVRLQFAINSLNSANYELADIHLEQLIDPSIEPNEHTFMRYHYWKSELEHDRKNYTESVYHASIGLNKIKQEDDYYFYLPRILKNLHNSEYQLNNHEKAYEYLSELNAWQDSLDIKERENKFIELEAKYQSEKKEIENALLTEQSISKTVKIQQRTTLAIASLLTLLLSLFLASILYRNSKKEKLNNVLLESKVAERTQKLKRSNEELERFAYIASHDLKEPITTIKGFTKLLKQKLVPEQKTTDVELYIDFIEKSSNQMLYLIKGILDYTKLGDDVNKTSVDLNEILQKVELYLYQIISTKNAKIVSKELPTINCNSILIFQIFKNLIENGIKFNESPECVVEINCKEFADYIILDFKDNGIGIDAKHKDQIFEMFGRLNNKNQYAGSGLGLSIVKKLTGLMDGEITLSKSDASGTTFSVKIPK